MARAVLDFVLGLAAYVLLFAVSVLVPVSPPWPLLLLPAGAFLMSLARQLWRPTRSYACILAAAVAGMLFSGLYLAAIDSAMNRSGPGLPDLEFYRTLLLFAATYGLIGGALLAAVALIGRGVADTLLSMRSRSRGGPG